MQIKPITRCAASISSTPPPCASVARAEPLGTWAPDHQRRSGGCCYRHCVAPYKTWRGARSSVVAAERAPLVRPLRLQPGVPPRVLLDNRPALQRHRLELGLGWCQHARLEVRVLLCGAVGRGAQTQDMVACMRAVYASERVAGAFALSSLMNFSLRLVCVSPSMRLMNSPVVDMRGCDSSILRSRERRTPRAGSPRLSNAQALVSMFGSLVPSPPCLWKVASVLKGD